MLYAQPNWSLFRVKTHIVQASGASAHIPFHVGQPGRVAETLGEWIGINLEFGNLAGDKTA